MRLIHKKGDSKTHVIDESATEKCVRDAINEPRARSVIQIKQSTLQTMEAILKAVKIPKN